MNILKTKRMCFGKLLNPLPLHGQILEWTSQHKYLRVHVTSYQDDIFSDHFDYNLSIVTNVIIKLHTLELLGHSSLCAANC